jgi:hypothetical protein
MKRIYFILIALVLANVGFSQETDSVKSTTCKYLIKTNILYWFTTTPNLSFETGLTNPKLSMDISVNVNPWKFHNGATFRHFLFQPEFRYWLGERFNGHFVGAHLNYAWYNVGGIAAFLPEKYYDSNWFNFAENRYEGNLFGAGVVYGYQWNLNNHWNLEATIGLGYVHMEGRTYRVEDNYGFNDLIRVRKYFTPTKLGFNLIYVINK